MTTIADLNRVGFILGDPPEVFLLRRTQKAIREISDGRYYDADDPTWRDLDRDITEFLARHDRGAPMREGAE